MHVERLRIEQFRVFTQAELALGPGLNLLVGPNGAGKTSILEALHLLAYGRSFRGGSREHLIRRGADELQVFCELRVGAAVRRIGLRRGLRNWEARLDGQPLALLSELYRQVAMLCFEPGSHALIGGGAEHRRRYLDWFLFHVEPEFLPAWRRYQRALKQRNALLKTGSAATDTALAAWDDELGRSGEALSGHRQHWLPRLAVHIAQAARRLLPELGAPELQFRRGWNEAQPLEQALAAQHGRDRALGHTGSGPHRADWSLSYAALPEAGMLSRGQEKLTALACLLAQGDALAAVTGQWPVLGLDDLASELDRPHLEQTLEWAQVLLTGTQAPPVLAGTRPSATFHVEQGAITRLI